jgi:AcrR family transcriptional regulator
MPKEPVDSRSVAKRQVAYSARNRSRLVRDAQNVLAEIGLEATMEQLSSRAEVSPTTIYKYFGSKEALFSEAILQMWQEWLEWACEAETPCESFESWVTTNRKFLRARQTHPFFGRVLRNILGNPDFLLHTLKGPSEKALKLLAKRGEIVADDLDIKVLLWSQAEAGIFSGVHATETLSPIQADHALGLSLKLFNISDSRIKELLSKDLNLSVAS